MIIVKLQGGIGNQLFQFAFGRALALYRGEDLFFDLSLLNGNIPNTTFRTFKLKHLTHYSIADQHTYDVLGNFVDEKKVLLLTDNFPKDQLDKFINDERIAAFYLEGYFQNDFYFTPFASEIKEELKNLLAYHYSLTNWSANEFVHNNQETVSIHLRRTDYLKPSTIRIHGICDATYYQAALDIVHSRLDQPHLYLFSDDAAIAEEMFSSLPYKTNISAIINQTVFEDKDMIELAIMTNCANFILANSSYSWWGSYLSQSINKLVIAPRYWYQHPAFYQQSEDIALSSWIRI